MRRYTSYLHPEVSPHDNSWLPVLRESHVFQIQRRRCSHLQRLLSGRLQVERHDALVQKSWNTSAVSSINLTADSFSFRTTKTEGVVSYPGAGDNARRRRRITCHYMSLHAFWNWRAWCFFFPEQKRKKTGCAILRSIKCVTQGVYPYIGISTRHDLPKCVALPFAAVHAFADYIPLAADGLRAIERLEKSTRQRTARPLGTTWSKPCCVSGLVTSSASPTDRHIKTSG